MEPVEAINEAVLEEVAFARRDGLPVEVEVLRLEELLKPPFKRETTKPTRTNFHTLLLVEAGMSSHHVDFERHSVGPGHLLVIPEGRVQAFDRARAICGYLALFTTGFLERGGLTVRSLVEPGQMLLRAGTHVQLSARSLTRVRHAFAVLADHTNSVPAGRFASEAIASAFSLLVFTVAGLAETTAAVVARTPGDELVVRFQEVLEARFRARHEASSYARALHVSLRTLDRHVLAAQGQTVRQAISARLVLETKRMLTRRDIPIKTIAYDLGFSEPQNLTRFFRTQTGLSPEAFRTSLDC